jgi:uncharacterized protein involved in response to NO
LLAALSLIVLLCTVIAGRIVPSFTANALRGIWQYKNPLLDRGAIGFTALALALQIFHSPAIPAAIAAAIAAVLQAARCWGWNPWATRKTPLLWILHFAHGWIPVAFALLALASLGLIPVSPVWHAFAVGTVGGLILGMITRTALGHTGRLLKASRLETVAYALLLVAALLRVGAPIIAQTQLQQFLDVSGACWSAAFALYLWRYAPMLWHPRVDGKKG